MNDARLMSNGFKLGMRPVQEIEDDNNYVEYIEIPTDIEFHLEQHRQEALEGWFELWHHGILPTIKLHGYLHGANIFNDAVETSEELFFCQNIVEYWLIKERLNENT